MQTATASSTPSQPPRELMVGEPGSPVGASAGTIVSTGAARP